ncbi:MAG: hypothetical protein HZB19_14385 [Chloroflexi bacterium]|nr:hypothetical protein [Chloroflexota bacterium]
MPNTTGTCYIQESTCQTNCVAPPTGTVRARTMVVPQTATSCTDVTGSTNYIPGTLALAPPGTVQSAPGDGSYAAWNNVQIHGGGEGYFLSSSVSSNYVLKLACWNRDTPAGSGTGTAASMSVNGSNLTWDIGYVSGTPWTQASGGDVYASGTLRSFVPSGTTPRVFSTDGSGGYPGVVTYGTSYDLDSGTGQGGTYISSTNWLVNDTLPAVDYYEYFWHRYGSPATSTTDPAFDNLLAVTKPPSSTTPYYVVGDLTTSGNWSVGSGESIVIIVDGNLTINGRVNITGSGFIAFIVNGNVTVDTTVGATSASTTPVVEGIYITSPIGAFVSGRL